MTLFVNVVEIIIGMDMRINLCVWFLLLLVSGNGMSQNKLETRLSKKSSFTGKLNLGDNTPNPFGGKQSTSISYTAIDAEVFSIIINDEDGKTILTFSNLPKIGEIVIKGDELPAGKYTYALIVNGRMVDRKKMTVQTVDLASLY
jgi:hypothetical protein